MPKSGSQIKLCDLPVRYDTYEGCSHQCSYCFVLRKNDLKVSAGEGVESLRSFINGNRTKNLNWCDWDIPIHWGGMSDPFQPIERKEKRSLEALKVFAETQYPFVVSTKNKLIAEEPYLSLIKQCNCVVQFSALCDRYDEFEKGASTFRERLESARKIAPYKRVIFRAQPYSPAILKDMLASIKLFAEVGAYGVVFESMKYTYKAKGTIRVGGDNVYPTKLLKEHFRILKDACHKAGLKFYSGENRLRAMGDELCCCGIDGLGWQPNTANLNHFLYDKENFKFRDHMLEKGTAPADVQQDTIYNKWRKTHSFKEWLESLQSESGCRCLMEDK